MRKLFLKAACLLVLVTPLPALATLTFTLDDANQTVALPATGTTTLTFGGVLTLGAGDVITKVELLFPFDSSGHGLIGHLLTLTLFDTGDADRFTIDVPSTAPLGLYDSDFTLTSPATLTYFYNDPTGAPHEVAAAFSVDVVSSAIPEPAALALLGLGFAAFAVTRRRKLN